MAQSGITSAVGICMEGGGGGGFRLVPRTLLSGANYAVGIPGTNPHRFATVEPGGGIMGKPIINVADAEIDGSVELTRTIHTGNEYMGGFAHKFDPEVAMFPFLGMFGVDVQTLLAGGASGGTSVFQHDLTPGKYVPSFTIEEILGDGTNGRLSSGEIINACSLDISDTVTMKWSGTAHRQIPNTYPNAAGVNTDYKFGTTPNVLPGQMGGDGMITMTRTATPNYVDVAQGNNGNGPHIFRAMTFGSVQTTSFLTIDDVAMNPLVVELLPGLTHDFSRKLDSVAIGGSGLDAGSVTLGGFTCTGKLISHFTDTQVLAASLRHSKIGINYKIPGILIGTSNVPYSLEVHIPHAKLLNVPLDIPDGPMLLNCDYIAKKDPAYGYSVKVRLVNTFDGSTLGGASGSTGTAGGAGGFSNSVAQGATGR